MLRRPMDSHLSRVVWRELNCPGPWSSIEALWVFGFSASTRLGLMRRNVNGSLVTYGPRNISKKKSNLQRSARLVRLTPHFLYYCVSSYMMESAPVLPRYVANCHCGAVKVFFYLDELLENKEIVICNCRLGADPQPTKSSTDIPSQVPSAPSMAISMCIPQSRDLNLYLVRAS